MAATIRPIHDKVLVKRKEAEGTTLSKLVVIPDQMQVPPDEGIVIAVGPGNYDQERGTRIPPQIAVGDHILFGKYAGAEIEVEGELVLLLSESEIYGTIER
jgi:chaperonin GroES